MTYSSSHVWSKIRWCMNLTPDQKIQTDETFFIISYSYHYLSPFFSPICFKKTATFSVSRWLSAHVGSTRAFNWANVKLPVATGSGNYYPVTTSMFIRPSSCPLKRWILKKHSSTGRVQTLTFPQHARDEKAQLTLLTDTSQAPVPSVCWRKNLRSPKNTPRPNLRQICHI